MVAEPAGAGAPTGPPPSRPFLPRQAAGVTRAGLRQVERSVAMRRPPTESGPGPVGAPDAESSAQDLGIRRWDGEGGTGGGANSEAGAGALSQAVLHVASRGSCGSKDERVRGFGRCARRVARRVDFCQFEKRKAASQCVSLRTREDGASRSHLSEPPAGPAPPGTLRGREASLPPVAAVQVPLPPDPPFRTSLVVLVMCRMLNFVFTQSSALIFHTSGPRARVAAASVTEGKAEWVWSPPGVCAALSCVTTSLEVGGVQGDSTLS